MNSGILDRSIDIEIELKKVQEYQSIRQHWHWKSQEILYRVNLLSSTEAWTEELTNAHRKDYVDWIIEHQQAK